MSRKWIIGISLLVVLVVSVGLFYLQTQRQKNIEKTREIFAPLYAFSGRLTPEQQKEFSEFTTSIMNVQPDARKEFMLPEREQLALEAHTMTLYRDNPELLFMGHGPFPNDTDIEPYRRHYGIIALIAKTKLVDFPASSRSVMIQHLEELSKRLVTNSVESYLMMIRTTPPGSSKKFPKLTFGVVSQEGSGEIYPIFQEDGSVKMPDEPKRGVVHLTDYYGNEYTVDLDSPTDIDITEDTVELYAKIDRLFEKLTDEELQRLSTLSKTERTVAIDKLFSSL